MMQSTTFQNNLEYARFLDDIDTLFLYRQRFKFPKAKNPKMDTIYFCGNTLGLQPNSVSYLINEELKKWEDLAIDGHFAERNPWLTYAEDLSSSIAKLVGAKRHEVIAMNSQTVNLHILMLSFYKPNKEKYKIIIEGSTFSTNHYAIETQVRMYGLDPEEVIIEINPREGEHHIREEDIYNIIEEHGEELALVMMAGIHYHTGQYFPIEKIVEKAHSVGALCGFDLAHAAGNVVLELHDWNVDFATWCNYKYLNAGPGAVASIYIHEKWANDTDTFRLAGWWGKDPETRFKMEKGFKPSLGAQSWQMSNAPVFNMVGLRASLDIFDTLAVADIREKSTALSSFLYFLLEPLAEKDYFKIITPKDQEQRGAQLTLLFKEDASEVHDYLLDHGVMVDWHEPHFIRVAPAPLYNTFEEVYKFASLLNNFFDKQS